MCQTNLLIKICSKYDLYSKSKVGVDVEKVKPYYMSLIEKVSTLVTWYGKFFCSMISLILLVFSSMQYFPAKLRW